MNKISFLSFSQKMNNLSNALSDSPWSINTQKKRRIKKYRERAKKISIIPHVEIK